MAHLKIVPSKIAPSQGLKSLRTAGALALTTLMLLMTAAAPATAQTYTDLYNFDVIHGGDPYYGPLTQGRDGNLYGTGSWYGANDQGVVFKITPKGTLTVLHNFDGTDGSEPLYGLALGTDGNFYGTASYGGTMTSCDGYGCGTVFKISTAGSLTTLHDFSSGTAEGCDPATLVQGANGIFYGTTFCATAFSITPSGAYTQLPHLPGPSTAPLFQGTDGNFYGTTAGGGSFGPGAVFKMTPEGILTTLYNFDGTHGGTPYGPIVQGSDGNFYGAARNGGTYDEGVIFKLTPQGEFTVLHNFGDSAYPNDGAESVAGLVQATDGSFYGVTSQGGTLGNGVIFKITPAGDYSILYNFDGPDGAISSSTPIQHTNGRIYGQTMLGGTVGVGVVFSLDAGLPPFVSLVSTTGKVGTSITILGQGFAGASAVSFNGTPAAFKAWSDTYLKATIPSGATTGPVTVTTPTGTLTSNHEFRVRPVILTITPASGAAGTPVTITGTSLTQTTKVTFGGGVAEATFTVNSDTQITATVPAGAPTGYIVLTTAGGKSRSPDTFTVTQ